MIDKKAPGTGAFSCSTCCWRENELRRGGKRTYRYLQTSKDLLCGNDMKLVPFGPRELVVFKSTEANVTLMKERIVSCLEQFAKGRMGPLRM